MAATTSDEDVPANIRLSETPVPPGRHAAVTCSGAEQQPTAAHVHYLQLSPGQHSVVCPGASLPKTRLFKMSCREHLREEALSAKMYVLETLVCFISFWGLVSLVRGQSAWLGVCSLEAEPGHSCLVISDNGCGVSIGHEARAQGIMSLSISSPFLS